MRHEGPSFDRLQECTFDLEVAGAAKAAAKAETAPKKKAVMYVGCQ